MLIVGSQIHIWENAKMSGQHRLDSALHAPAIGKAVELTPETKS